MTNIAVVVLDTLRYDRFLRAFEWLDGMHFTRAYSTSHWTIPAHASLFTGQYASSVNVHGQSPTLDCDQQPIASDLREAGYNTTCLSANTQLNQYDGWDRGFEEFVKTPNLGRTDDRIFDWGAHIEQTQPGWKRYFNGFIRCFSGEVDTWRSLRYGVGLIRTPSYEGGARAVRKRLQKMEFGAEEFLFVNLMDAHTPYYPPPGESDPVTVVLADALSRSVDQPDKVRAAYDVSVDVLSEMYRDIHGLLLESFDYVITLSDHGELLGEHELWNHSVGLHPELVHVPLIVSGPDVDSEARHEPVNLLDVHRTIGALAGIDVDSEGRNLIEPVPPRRLITESHGILPFHRDQFERKDVPEELYEQWRKPLFGFVTRNGSYCYQIEPEFVRCIGRPRVDPYEVIEDLASERSINIRKKAQQEVSDEVRKRLEELGYA